MALVTVSSIRMQAKVPTVRGPFKGRLRVRIVISFLIFGTVLSMLFALTALGMRQYLNNALIDETLKSDLRIHLDSVSAGTAALGEPFSSRYVAWVGRPDLARTRWLGAPEDLRPQIEYLLQLPDGAHAFSHEQQRYRVAVEKRPDVWGYVFYDATPDPREKWVLLGAVLLTFALFILLALALAIWSSKRVIAPVADLARRIRHMGDDIHPEPLAPNYAADEVGQLAEALDAYADRLTALVVRDKEFNADVSHELRTPLAVIKGSTELLLGQPGLDDKTQGRLKRIERAAKQSTELTEALLHLVRAEKMDHATGEFYRIERIVEEVIDFKRPQLAGKPVDVKLAIEEPFLVCAPAAVIAVAVGNLIGNAFKYTPKGSVVITIRRGEVVVEDTGPGLKDDELQAVFTRHYRGSSATGKGSGLGLAIVQRFCELYDWGVDISPRDNGGLCAILRFYSKPATPTLNTDRNAHPTIDQPVQRSRNQPESA